MEANVKSDVVFFSDVDVVASVVVAPAFVVEVNSVVLVVGSTVCGEIDFGTILPALLGTRLRYCKHKLEMWD